MFPERPCRGEHPGAHPLVEHLGNPWSRYWRRRARCDRVRSGPRRCFVLLRNPTCDRRVCL